MSGSLPARLPRGTKGPRAIVSGFLVIVLAAGLLGCEIKRKNEPPTSSDVAQLVQFELVEFSQFGVPTIVTGGATINILTFSGKVKNVGSRTAFDIRVTFTVFDKAGAALVQTDVDLPGQTRVDPGGTAHTSSLDPQAVGAFTISTGLDINAAGQVERVIAWTEIDKKNDVVISRDFTQKL